MGDKRRTVWMLTFESRNVVKVGGLAEVPYNLAVHMVDSGWEPHVIMPSHGRHDDPRLRERLNLRREMTLRFTVGGHEAIVVVERGEERGVVFHLLEGGNRGAEALNDSEVYGKHVLDDKVKLFSNAVSLMAFTAAVKGWLPDVIHAHDWHGIPAMIASRLKVERCGYRSPATILHIHLLSKKKAPLEFFIEAGVPPLKKHRIVWDGGSRVVTVKELWERAEGLVEKVGAWEADLVVTVSMNFLKYDEKGVLKTLGADIEWKSGYVYNGTDWSYEDALKEVLERHGETLRRLGMGTSRDELRRYLLLHALALMPKDEPRPPDSSLSSMILEVDEYPFLGGGRVAPFPGDGPLVLMTGRTSKQKGLHVLVKALPKVIERIPDVRVLLLLIPVWGGEKLIEMIIDACVEYPENLRAVLGMAPSVFKLAHVSADVYVMPSLWEPFGIAALEGMATGNPVVASAVGGLKEIVLDVREHGVKGTGLQVPPGRPEELAKAISSMVVVMRASREPNKLEELIELVEDEIVKGLLKQHPQLGNMVRKACMRRVREAFTWPRSSKMAIEAYSRALSIASLRA